MSERIVQDGQLELWTESFGAAADPAVLLIMGAESQGTAWPLPLIDELRKAGRRVLRYDHRDVGQSTVFDFRQNPYDLDELAADAVTVLDAWEIEKAHVVGASMGGMITQLLLARHPHRLHSATLVMSTPLAGNLSDAGSLLIDDPSLPASSLMRAMAAAPPQPVPTERETYARERVELFAGLSDPEQVDTDLLRRMFEMEFDRARDIRSKANHGLAIAASEPKDRRALLASVTTPTTVVHGEKDPILPIDHGLALAQAIPGAEMRRVDGMAHDLPPQSWPHLVAGVRDRG
ncbi:MAG: alpha/beta hydrolase [Acidobacteriota bacterium]